MESIGTSFATSGVTDSLQLQSDMVGKLLEGAGSGLSAPASGLSAAEQQTRSNTMQAQGIGTNLDMTI